MKSYSTIVALCALYPSILGASAFVQGPKSAAFKAQTAKKSQLASSSINGSVTDRSTGLNSPGVSGGAAGALNRNSRSSAGSGPSVNSIWDTLTPVTVQGGGSLRTWSFATPDVERVQVLMKTEGRPLSASVDLWQGPDNTPQKMAVYLEDGDMRTFSAVIETPRGSNTVAIRNIGMLEYPLSACVEADMEDASGTSGLGSVTQRLSEMGAAKIVQGGAIHTYPFDPYVESVQVLLKTDGRPLNARIELLQGPNNNKQVVEIYTEDGLERPFFAVIETPGVGNVVRIVNTATVEFPLAASVEPYQVLPGADVPSSSGRGWDTGGLVLDR